MNQFWSRITRELSPYVPGEQPRVDGLIKLNTNEHPLPPSNRVMAALAEVTADQLRRYPDPAATALRQSICEQEGLDIDQVFVGNGSDEVLAHVFQALLTARDGFSVPDITYSFYPVWAKLYNLACRIIPLTDSLAVDIPRLQASDDPILLANPNAPTGIALDLAAIKDLVHSNPNRLVVIDEAYYGFGSESAASLLRNDGEYEGAANLLITRTLSKSHALAGLRVGYALGHPDLIAGLIRVKDSFNSYPLDALAQAGAQAAIDDKEWFASASAEVCAVRDSLATALEGLDFSVCPSQANFLFVRHRSHAGKALFEGLRAHNILVRRWDSPRIKEHLRITVGTRDQSARLISVLEKLLAPEKM